MPIAEVGITLTGLLIVILIVFLILILSRRF